jgi:hypothetical protein
LIGKLNLSWEDINIVFICFRKIQQAIYTHNYQYKCGVVKILGVEDIKMLYSPSLACLPRFSKQSTVIQEYKSIPSVLGTHLEKVYFTYYNLII